MRQPKLADQGGGAARAGSARPPPPPSPQPRERHPFVPEGCALGRLGELWSDCAQPQRHPLISPSFPGRQDGSVKPADLVLGGRDGLHWVLRHLRMAVSLGALLSHSFELIVVLRVLLSENAWFERERHTAPSSREETQLEGWIRFEESSTPSGEACSSRSADFPIGSAARR